MTDEQAPAPWLGKEMLRQVELRLQAQATALAALEGRAAGLLTLCGSGILALGATVVAAQSPAWQHGALTAVAMLLLAAIILMIR